MNRFVIVFLLACCASLTALPAQTAPGKTNKGRKTATAPARKASRRARPVPATGLLSVGELQSLRMKALEEI